MMKKIVIALVTVVVSLMAAGSGFAAQVAGFDKNSYGPAGCGLGSMIFGSQPGIVQVVAATTNGTSGNQTFGITFGTSNCGTGIISASNDKLNNFVSANMDQLAQDMSRGSGESLQAVAELMEIPQNARLAAYAKLQGNFSAIFASENIESAQVINQMTSVLGL